MERKLLAVLLSLAGATRVFAQSQAVPGKIVLPALAPSFAAPAASLSAAPSAAVALTPAAALAAPVPAAPALPSAVSMAKAVPAASEAPSQVPGEQAKAAADALFDGSRAPSAPAVFAAPTSGAQPLSPASASLAERLRSVRIDPGPRVASLWDRVRDRARYATLMSRSFWWYMYTHIGDMWPSYRGRWEKARAEGPVAVSRPRAFFSAMRVVGMSGRFYVLGGSALEDDLVIEEFRGAFARYVDGPGVGERERASFEAFMARAKVFNAEKRAHTNMYKNIRDPLIKASTMRPDQLAAFFDAQLPPEKAKATLEFQRSGRQELVRDAFLKALKETLDEEDPRAENRVRAAVVLGSFASGSAGPGSDFDVEAMVNGADNARLADFTNRLVARWTAAGYHKSNPVTVHDNATWPSWGFINLVQNRDYIVVSPEPALQARLTRQKNEFPAMTIERRRTLRGRFNRLFQRALVATATYVSDAQAALK